MERIETRRDAEDYVEDRLGPDGDRELAEAFVEQLHSWRAVTELTDVAWSRVLRDAIRSLPRERTEDDYSRDLKELY